jgi:hypothetical protein
MRFRKTDAGERTPEAVVEALNLDDQVNFDDLLAAVTRAHGKPIELKEVDNTVIPTVTGLWVEKDAKSVILLPARDSRLHRNHATFHEFGHILLNHEGCGLSSTEIVTPSIFKHIGSRGGIKRMLARSLEWNDTERAAEHVAYLLSLAVLPPVEPKSTSNYERAFG